MNIAVIGAGKRGTGIAQLVALGGHKVALFDTDAEQTPRARIRILQYIDTRLREDKIKPEEATAYKDGIFSATALEQCTEADIMIEAITDTLEAKSALIEKMDRLAPRTTILVTTTASLLVTVIATAAKRYPERITGIHFFEPVTTRSLVEVVPGDQTAEDIRNRCLYFLQQLGKDVITARDIPGFIVDRLSTLYTGEALRLVGEGQTTPETVDKLMNSLEITPGPFRLIDSIGVDIHLELTLKLYNAFFQEPRYRPHPIQRKMVQSRRLGRKTKQGFYKYDE